MEDKVRASSPHLLDIAWVQWRYSTLSEKTEEGENASVWMMLKAAEAEQDDLMENDARPEDQQEAEELAQRMSSDLTISH
jgi:hypothetical protein